MKPEFKHLIAVFLLLGALFCLTLSWDPIDAQIRPPQLRTEVPNPQLIYVTKVPPSQWELDGLVAASDVARVLLRHKETRYDAAEHAWMMFGRTVYRAEHFDSLESPILTKLRLKEGEIEIVSAPGRIIMMPGYRIILPLLVRNERPEPELLRVRSRWKDYDFVVPPESVRGFCLNLQQDVVGLQSLAMTFEAGGANASFRLEADVRPVGTVRVDLHDPENQPVAARIYLTGSDGLAHMPLGAFARILWRSGEYFFHAKDSFEIVLPAGEAVIEAVRGMEYAPVRKTINVRPDQTHPIRMALDRRYRLHEENWYSSDVHIHANCTNNEVIGVDDVFLQVLAEGLDIANLMVSNSDGRVLHDYRFFEGKPHRLSQKHRILYWNEEMRNRALYGHMSFLNLRQLVHPIYTGFPGTPHAEDYPANYTQAKQARSQGGAVTYVHPTIRADFKGAGPAGAKEFPVDLALGEVDALDVLSNFNEPGSMELWYRALNCGFRCAISAGSDAFTNVLMATVAGGCRVYVKVPGSFSYNRWIENFKKGRSFATNGPFLTLSVADQEPGGELRLPPDAPATVQVRAEARSLVPMETLEIVVNESVVASQKIGASESLVQIEREVLLDRSAWIAARVFGPAHRLVLNDAQVFAHTSPVYCYLGDSPIASRSDAAFWVDWIEQLIASVKQRGFFETPQKRDSVIELFRRAQTIYRTIAETAGSR